MKLPLPSDDPQKRKPDISNTKVLLNWEPSIDIEKDLIKPFFFGGCI